MNSQFSHLKAILPGRVWTFLGLGLVLNVSFYYAIAAESSWTAVAVIVQALSFTGLLFLGSTLRWNLMIPFFGYLPAMIVLTKGPLNFGLPIALLTLVGAFSKYFIMSMVGGITLRRALRLGTQSALPLAVVLTLVESGFAALPAVFHFPLILGLSTCPTLLQTLSLSGQSIVVITVWLASATAVEFLIRSYNGQKFEHALNSNRTPLLLALVLILFVVVYGVIEIQEAEVPSAEVAKVRFGVLQGGLPRETYLSSEDSPQVREEITTYYLNLVEQAAKMGFDKIIWPESPLWRDQGQIQERVSEVIVRNRLNLIGGAMLKRNQSVYNAVLWMNPQGKVGGEYLKHFLIPFTEAQFMTGAGTGDILRTSFGNFATPICYEILFPYFLRRMVNQGAEAVILVSNDAGFKVTPISLVVFKESIFRAVELRRWVVRDSQAGISGVIDPKGHVVSRTDLFENVIFPAEINLIQSTTLFGRFGDWFSIALLFGLGVGVWARRR